MKMRLIDADVALAAVKPYESSDEMWSVTGGTAIRLIHNAIDNAPTVDAVPVVRCRDCVHFVDGKRPLCYLHTAPYKGINAYLGMPFDMEPDDFCSYGERKNEPQKNEENEK